MWLNGQNGTKAGGQRSALQHGSALRSDGGGSTAVSCDQTEAGARRAGGGKRFERAQKSFGIWAQRGGSEEGGGLFQVEAQPSGRRWQRCRGSAAPRARAAPGSAEDGLQARGFGLAAPPLLCGRRSLAKGSRIPGSAAPAQRDSDERRPAAGREGAAGGDVSDASRADP